MGEITGVGTTEGRHIVNNSLIEGVSPEARQEGKQRLLNLSEDLVGATSKDTLFGIIGEFDQEDRPLTDEMFNRHLTEIRSRAEGDPLNPSENILRNEAHRAVVREVAELILDSDFLPASEAPEVFSVNVFLDKLKDRSPDLYEETVHHLRRQSYDLRKDSEHYAYWYMVAESRIDDFYKSQSPPAPSVPAGGPDLPFPSVPSSEAAPVDASTWTLPALPVEEPAETIAPGPSEPLPRIELDLDKEYTPDELETEILRQAGKEGVTGSERDRILLTAIAINSELAQQFYITNLRRFNPEGEPESFSPQEISWLLGDQLSEMIIKGGFLPDDPEVSRLRSWIGTFDIDGGMTNRLYWLRNNTNPANLSENVRKWIEYENNRFMPWVGMSSPESILKYGLRSACLIEARKANPDLYQLSKAEIDQEVSNFEDVVLNKNVEAFFADDPEDLLQRNILIKNPDGTLSWRGLEEEDNKRLFERLKEKCRNTSTDVFLNDRDNFTKWQELLKEPEPDVPVVSAPPSPTPVAPPELVVQPRGESEPSPASLVEDMVAIDNRKGRLERALGWVGRRFRGGSSRQRGVGSETPPVTPEFPNRQELPTPQVETRQAPERLAEETLDSLLALSTTGFLEGEATRELLGAIGRMHPEDAKLLMSTMIGRINQRWNDVIGLSEYRDLAGSLGWQTGAIEARINELVEGNPPIPKQAETVEEKAKKVAQALFTLNNIGFLEGERVLRPLGRMHLEDFKLLRDPIVESINNSWEDSEKLKQYQSLFSRLAWPNIAKLDERIIELERRS